MSLLLIIVVLQFLSVTTLLILIAYINIGQTNQMKYHTGVDSVTGREDTLRDFLHIYILHTYWIAELTQKSPPLPPKKIHMKAIYMAYTSMLWRRCCQKYYHSIFKATSKQWHLPARWSTVPHWLRNNPWELRISACYPGLGMDQVWTQLKNDRQLWDNILLPESHQTRSFSFKQRMLFGPSVSKNSGNLPKMHGENAKQNRDAEKGQRRSNIIFIILMIPVRRNEQKLFVFIFHVNFIFYTIVKLTGKNYTDTAKE